MNLLAARIGSTVHYDQPYTPTQKAKVERWLREWKEQYAPHKPEEEWHPLFCEALEKKDYIEYLLDILLYAPLSERVELVTDYGEEVLRITDRYEAAAYGWTEALDRYEENFPEWIEVIPETVTRCTDKHDIPGNVLFEGDVYRNPDNLLFEVCYGKYQTYCPADKRYMENVGFFAISRDVKEIYGIDAPMPLGSTEDYAYLVGNIFDSPELRQDAGQSAGQWADQPTLRPAT